ncbi:MAG: UPF0175 family protein [Ferruginibacter sp.]
MKTFTISIPDNLEIEETELKLRVAAQLYDERKISLGEGAAIAEVSKRDFIENLGRFGVSLFNYDTEDLLEEIKNA